MARHLFIVAREHQGLYDYLLERFANDEKVTVILDRRTEGQRPSQDNRGRGERRQNPLPENEPWPRSHQIITLEDPVPAS